MKNRRVRVKRKSWKRMNGSRRGREEEEERKRKNRR